MQSFQGRKAYPESCGKEQSVAPGQAHRVSLGLPARIWSGSETLCLPWVDEKGQWTGSLADIYAEALAFQTHTGKVESRGHPESTRLIAWVGGDRSARLLTQSISKCNPSRHHRRSSRDMLIPGFVGDTICNVGFSFLPPSFPPSLSFFFLQLI